MNATIMKMQQDKMQNPYNNMVPPMMGQYPMMMAPPYMPNNGQYNYNHNNNKGGKRRNPGKKFDFYNRYCWSCGGCDHWGRKCAHKKQGHKDNASFRNKQGGSVDNCFNS